MKATDYIVSMIEETGCSVIFGYIGGSIADLIDSIYQSKKIRFVQTYHEQAAAYAANGYAQVSGNIGIAISSSGPGAINLLNGIANAYFDSIASLFITGNVHTYSSRCDRELRQNAFQETDIVEMVSGITKYAVRIEDERHLQYCLMKAIYVAQSGRPGPVLIDIPYDIQRKDIELQEIGCFKGTEHIKVDEKILNKFDALLSKSKKPLILVGGGARGAAVHIRKFVDSNHIPVVSSLRALDVVGDDRIGFIGSYGNRAANMSVYHCDLLIVVGARLDERQIGYNQDDFAPDAVIVRIDNDINEIYHNCTNNLGILADAVDFFESYNSLDYSHDFSQWKELLIEWKNIIDPFGETWPFANRFIRSITEKYGAAKILVADVGQNQMITAQAAVIKDRDFFLCSSGLGGMGYSLPAAIGAYYGDPSKTIICVCGDGGIQMNIQEMQTCVREKIPIKIVILNNHSLGMIRNLQDKLFEGRYFASVEGYSTPDFGQIATAYGMEFIRINDICEYDLVLEAFGSSEAVVIEVGIPMMDNVYPEPGEKIYLQNPELNRSEVDMIQKSIQIFDSGEWM